MKTVNKQIGFLVLLLALLFCHAQRRGDYAVPWHTIDGGGGTSKGGLCIVRGTTGQHDAAYSYGESYELLGGFWPGEPLCIVNFEHFARFAQ